MPTKTKHKTHKAAAKRFTVTKSGKVRHKKAGMGHLMSHMKGKRKRQLRKDGYLDASVVKTYRKMLGV